MKYAIATSMFGMALSAVVATSIGVTAHARLQNNRNAVRYSVVNLGTLGGSLSGGEDINQEGTVGGGSYLHGDKFLRAWLWRDGQRKVLPRLGGLGSNVRGVNDSGTASGNAETATPDPLGENFCGAGYVCPAVLWHDGNVTALPTLGGNNASALNINNHDEAVGFAETAKHDTTCTAPQVLQVRAVVWDPEARHARQLPSLPGDADGAAEVINERGDIVGESGTCSSVLLSWGDHAVLWRNGKVFNLGGLGGATNTGAQDINNASQVVGSADLPGDMLQHAFFWQKGTMTDLGTLPGASQSEAFGINDSGQVIGTSCDSSFGNCRAFLWQRGAMTDLNTLVGSTVPLYLVTALAINDRGEITGYGYDPKTGKMPAYVAIPDDRAPARAAGNSRRRFMLPDRVREHLRHKVLARFRLGL